MKQSYEYDLHTARGLYEYIADRVFKPNGVHNDYWSALESLYVKAKSSGKKDKEIERLTEMVRGNCFFCQSGKSDYDKEPCKSCSDTNSNWQLKEEKR